MFYIKCTYLKKILIRLSVCLETYTLYPLTHLMCTHENALTHYNYIKTIFVQESNKHKALFLKHPLHNWKICIDIMQHRSVATYSNTNALIDVL